MFIESLINIFQPFLLLIILLGVSLGLGFLVVCEIEISKLSSFDSKFTNVVFPAPDGEDKIIITPPLSMGI